ncbi:type II toxin-antitoxin system RelE/ParE family toxin [Coraliomargarita sp. SDUM461003]|uniref:Type II toxin-antitoxin system RelE/ParE family toxin n=1 Tax=Thalassobacterium maritimum TaxID=3041265 RepID=A0ABU1B031_9BACT|nr:type II toxin-antitoxin system RelE/ParE family toxin [Coraliomargarita sp. SDUM461003]MDQ8209748.1 type II toxin-antitoxin system RelE/ParE family toxin [Coraliomargarita sp. SDUM461003]
MQIRHLNEAVADAQREVKFWREQEPGLENEFARKLDAAIQTISLSPNGYVKVSQKRELRRFYEKRFHTHILYEYLADEDLLQIVRVYNARMNPIWFIPKG